MSRAADRARSRAAPLALAFLCVLLLAAPPAAAQEKVILTGIDVAPEGKLIRVTFRTSAPMEAFVLSRQGPPEKRDLVIRLRGAGSALSVPPTDVSGAEPAVPYQVSVSEEDGVPVVKVVMERAGDSLVRLDHDGGGLSFILIPPETRRNQSAGAYRIGPDDVLAISVFGHDDLTKTAKVSPDGLFNFPLIGNVRAGSRTVDDVAAEIQERLARDFLVEPHVTVSVWEYLSQWVNVIGEVAKPGRYYLTGPTTLIDAISQAGGFRPTAGEAILVTRRAIESDPQTAGEVHRLSTAAVLSEDKTAAGFGIRSGDVVNVLAREVIYVSGEVRNPGAYPLERSATLLKVVTLAGGFTGAANTSALEIIREEEGVQHRLSFSVKEIEDQKIPDPVLKAGDVVVVKHRS